MDQERFDLTVTIPAAELAHLRRRLLFLEAALVQVLRGEARVKEWFTAAELVTLRLPGLPSTRAGITRQAKAEGWATRPATCRGGRVHYFHFSSLPRRTFEALIDLVVKALPAIPEEEAGATCPALPVPPMVDQAAAGNTAPPWVLPLMRIVRAQGASIPEAVDELRRRLPSGVRCPSLDEAMGVLRSLGMVS
ncbi:MAG: hypothetical protein HQL40_15440 [Alphaproteobacteria bacterium]|nr:hypothetical protein [Alphaproteobacteria bacterium]